MPQVISRADAIKSGLKKYFTGEPCVNGHTSERQAANWRCVGCIKQKSKKRPKTLSRKISKKVNKMLSKVLCADVLHTGPMLYLGCDIEKFRSYISLQFKEGMSWKNYGEWHLDHKIPVSKFNLRNEEEAKIAFHYTNYQPLWAIENMKKSAKIENFDARVTLGILRMMDHSDIMSNKTKAALAAAISILSRDDFSEK